MKRVVIISGLAFLLALGSGCAGFGAYMKDRGNDFADCFTARAGICYGLGVRAQASNYLGASIGLSVGKKAGYFGRQYVEAEGNWVGIPLLQLATPFLVVWPSIAEEYGNQPYTTWHFIWDACTCLLGTSYEHNFDAALPDNVRVLGFNLGEFVHPIRMEPPTPFIREKFFVEVGVTLFAVSFDAGFNPVEFVDFLLGWTTLDITGDDTVHEPEREAEP
jgi:hypothetical protein